MTLFGICFIILLLISFVFKPGWLLTILIVAAVFQAASVANISVGGYTFGIQPYYLAAFSVLMYFLFLLASGKAGFRVTSVVIVPLFVFLAFAVWSVLTGLLLPTELFFKGMPVYAPRAGIGPEAMSLQPLHWSFSNLAQMFYLALNLVALSCVTLLCTKKGYTRQLKHGLYLAGAIVVFIGLYQRLADLAGLYFPSGFLYSNPVYFQAYGISIGGLGRTNATFAEASLAGAYLAAFVCFVLIDIICRPRRSRWRLVMLGLSIVTLVLSASSTAYLALLVILFIVAIRFVAVPLMQGKVSKQLLPVVLVIIVAGILLISLVPAIREIVPTMLFEKSASASYFYRISADLYALGLAGQTHGLGVGLGSNRPSSFLAYLLSNVGLIGLGLFVLAMTALFFAARRRIKLSAFSEYSGLLRAVAWGTAAVLITKVIAVPDLSDAVLWSFLVCLFGISASEAGTEFEGHHIFRQ